MTGLLMGDPNLQLICSYLFNASISTCYGEAKGSRLLLLTLIQVEVR